MKDLHEPNEELGALMITIFILGYAIGPLFLAPLSELYGRYPVVVCSSWFFNAWLLGCSFAVNMPSLIVMRLLAGIGGSAVMTIAPAIVGDIFPLEKRAFGSGLIIMSQSLGPIIGPICGGFIAERLGWRWAYWILVSVAGTVTILITIFMKESNITILLQRKTARLSHDLDRHDLAPLLQLKLTKGELIRRSLIRPIKLLTRSPIALLISLYIATIYSTLYLLFTTIPTVFEDVYGWSPQFTGLAYIGLGIGMTGSLLYIILTNDAKVAKLRARNNGRFEPEMRLAETPFFAICMPIGLIWYGWVTQKHCHWILAVVSLLPFGMGMSGLFLPAQTYMVDTFPFQAASAVAAPTCARSLLGAFLPLAGPPLYGRLGFGWGNTLLGLVALVMVPIPLAFLRYGGYVRKKYPVQL